ncbi:MAG: hypothetical protein HYX96_04305 [Chloroflexi bacterium]|nr:hypothetical protein [Chloroflexota bacterium]
MRKIWLWSVLILAVVGLGVACTGPGASPTATAKPGPAAGLVFVTQPGGTTAGTPFIQPVLKVVDGEGDAATGAQVLVTLSITPGTGGKGAVLYGPTTINSVDGMVTFRDLFIDVAGAGYTLTASARGLETVASEPFDVKPGTAAKLVFGKQPGPAIAGSMLSVQPAVRIEDAYGNLVNDASLPVTLVVVWKANSADAVLAGTTTVNALNGIATFSGLYIERSSSYSLTASSGGLSQGTSGYFQVLPAPPSKVAFTMQPAGAKAGAAFTIQPEVEIQDVYGNTIESTEPVSIAITPGTGAGGAVLSGTTTIEAFYGMVSYQDLAIDLAGEGYTLTASSGSLTAGVSGPFDVTP